MRTLQRVLPAVLVTLGVVTFLLGRRFDGGFLMGFFQGATVALMVGAVYLVWALVFRRTDAQAMWRPSEDGPSGGRR